MAKKRSRQKPKVEPRASIDATGEARSLAETPEGVGPSPPGRGHVFTWIRLVLGGLALTFTGLIALGLSPAMVMLGLAAVAAVGVTLLVVFTFHSLVTDPPAEAVKRATGRRRKELEREKQSLLKALKELSFDHEMRKISDEDYRDVASTYRARAVRVMRQLDEAGGDFRKLVEQDAAARRLARGSGAQPPVVYREPEAPPAPEPAAAPASPVAAATVPTAPAAVPTAPATGSAAPVSAVPGRRLCAACAADNDPDAVFCKKCGKAIQAAAEGGR